MVDVMYPNGLDDNERQAILAAKSVNAHTIDEEGTTMVVPTSPYVAQIVSFPAARTVATLTARSPIIS
jgi:hypothetical protein